MSTPAASNSSRPRVSFFSSIIIPTVCGIPQHTATQAKPRNAGSFASVPLASALVVASTTTSDAAIASSAMKRLAVSATAAMGVLDAVGATTRARCAVRVTDRVGIERRARAGDEVERDIVVIIARGS